MSTVGFYTNIGQQFGQPTSLLLKSWQNTSLRIVFLQHQLSFLLQCRSYEVIPNHIQNLRINNCNFKSKTGNRKYEQNIRTYKKNLMNIEIEDAHINIKYQKEKLNIIENKIKEVLPNTIYNRFFELNKNSYRKLNDREEKRLKNKFELLKNKQNADKNKFLAGELEQKWIVNLTDIDVPFRVQKILSLGDKFGFPITNFKQHLPVSEFAKEVEFRSWKIDRNLLPKLRTDLVGLLVNTINKKHHVDSFDKELRKMEKETNQFLRENNNLLVTKADKGQSTVIMGMNDYKDKMNSSLSDINTYLKIDKDPLNMMKQSVNELVRRWKDKKYIDDDTYKYLRSPNDNHHLPRCYGLPKIHKDNNPLRIIVSSVNSPTYNLSKYLTNIISTSIPKPKSNIKDGWTLVESLKGVSVPRDCALVSFDVVSLFTNIPRELVEDGIKRRWKHISRSTAIPESEFSLAVRILFNNTFFRFDSQYYSQTYGGPMGSPSSPIFADMVLEDLEKKCFEELNFKPIKYYRYVDDCFMIIPRDRIEFMLNIFNSYHNRLKFTCEIETNGSLSFLNVMIIKETDGAIKTNWYQKPIASGRCLNFFSSHPMTQKISTVTGLIDHAILLSSPIFHEDNINKVKVMLSKNNYPKELVDEIIKNRLKKHNTRHDNITTNQSDNFIVFPYIKNLSEKIQKKYKNCDFKIVHKSNNQCKSKFIRKGKDKIDNEKQLELVYKINCNDCDKVYVGQTKRYVEKRKKEHQTNITKSNVEVSVISKHRIDNNHDFDWEKIEILHKEPNYKKRLFMEMAYIKKYEDKTINKQKDLQHWNDVYDRLLDYME